jgi:1,4-alpha-glucan branching enzyme
MNFFYPLIISIFFLLSGCAPKSLAPQATHEGVRFSLSAPAAKNVSIAGNFNHWSPNHDRLTGSGQKGIWTIVLPLSPGRYEYRFVLNDKEWVLDPSVPSVDDGLGDKNSVFVFEP